MDLLFPQPFVDFFQNILCSATMFIEARSVNQDDAIFISFRLGGAYGMILGLETVAGPVRFLSETIYKLLQV